MGTAQTGRAPRLLVISNDAMLLGNATRFLTAFGYTVDSLGSPALAEQVVRLARPELLIVDVRPGSGVDARRLGELSSDDGLPRPRLLALSAAHRSHGLSSLVAAGADDVVHAGAWGELLARLRAATRALELERNVLRRCDLDPVTGLPGPTRLGEVLADRGQQDKLAYVEVRLDYYSHWRERHGLDVAERAEALVAESLREASPAALALARLAPGRYAALLAGGSSEAADWSDHVRGHVEQQPRLGEGLPQVTICCGVAETAAVDDADALFAAARHAVEIASERGGNRVFISGEAAAADEAWRRQAGAGTMFCATTAGELMAPATWTLDAELSLKEAATVLEHSGVRVLPVTRDGALLGLLPRELCDAGEPNERVGAHARTDVPTVQHDTPFSRLWELFEQGHDTLVVLRDQQPAGLLLAEELATLGDV